LCFIHWGSDERVGCLKEGLFCKRIIAEDDCLVDEVGVTYPAALKLEAGHAW